jgi:peptidoglycan/LPS O-acetylase OafA/YrhL
MPTASPPERPTIAYQPALDGVRALAVAAVLLFHAEVPGLSGGYLGVSVFFTLSGFLITSLLVFETDASGRVSLGAFFARRARRLLPASMLCVSVIVALSATTDWFAGVAELRRQVIGSLLQVANWVFLFGEGSYQDLFQQASGAVSPLEHYWSLAIEEQFYWLWPVSFLGLVTVAKSRRAQVRVLGVVTLLAALCAPLVAAVWGGDAAYWATPARAAEILVGALLAVVIAGRTVDRRWAAAAPVALGLLVVAFVTFPASGGPAYAGALPLVGVVSAALLLGLQAPGPVRSALGVAPAVWLGRISYGVYLYHWPIFVVLDERRTGLDPLPLLVVRVMLTLAVAQLSFTFFEQPIRRGRRRAIDIGRPASGRRTFATAAAATVAVIVGTVVVVPSAESDYWTVSAAVLDAAAIAPSDEPLAPLVETATPVASAPVTAEPPPEAVAPAPSSPSSTSSTTTTTITITTTIPPLPELSRPVRIMVAGDSTAEAIGVGLLGWAAASPALAQVELDAVPGCGFVRGGDVFVQDWRPVPDRCDTWLDTALVANVAALQPDVVLLTTTSWDVLDHRWETGERFVPADEPFRVRLERDFSDITDALLDAGAATVVWIRHPLPNPLWLSSGQAQEDPARHAILFATMEAIAVARPGRVEVIELDTWLEQAGYDRDVDLRPDGVHWSPEASRQIADGYLGEQLVRAALGLPRP